VPKENAKIIVNKHMGSLHPDTGDFYNFTSKEFCRYLVKFPEGSK